MKKRSIIALAFCLLSAGYCRAEYHTNVITTPGGVYAFSVDGSPAVNPTIDLVAGVTNVFVINTASLHPVVVVNPDFSYYGGAAPQLVYNTPISVTTPTTGFPTNLYYMCGFHAFYGEIHIAAPAGGVPPPNTILEVHVGTNVVMTSTGTETTWTVVPEFTSNLVSGVWATVPDYSNQFANGTNITTFPRLDPICGPNVFLRIRQQEPD